MREIDTNSWRLDSYDRFDGTMSQSFQSTSVHLSFTDYHVPIFDGERGSYDNQIFFLESVVSVQDKGKWVADVDPLPLISCHNYVFGVRLPKPGIPEVRIVRLANQTPCPHKTNSYADQDITTVDTWNELLDAPAGMFVVRTGDNWVSRLATTLVAHQRMAQISTNFKIVVCPPEVCWPCANAKFETRVFIF